MKKLLLLFIVLFSTTLNSQTVFVQEYGLRGNLDETLYYPLSTPAIEYEAIGIVSPVKLPMGGSITELFVSGDVTPFNVELVTIKSTGEYIPVASIASHLDIGTNGYVKFALDPVFTFDQGSYLAFHFTPVTTPPTNDSNDFFFSYTIEWNYENATFVMKAPTLGTWALILLSLILLILGTLASRQKNIAPPSTINY